VSYDETLPTDRDTARALLGDTSNDAATELLTDAHIDAALVLYPPLAQGVAFLADELSARFAQEPTSVSASGKSVSWGTRIQQWQALAARLRATNSVTLGGAFAVASSRNDGYSQLAAEEAAL
jgi:hypothetical protein